MRSSKYSTLLRILLVVVALAGLAYWAADTRDRFEAGLRLDQHARDPFDMNADTRRVTRVEPEAAQAGIVKGATVESLNGAPYTGVAQWNEIGNPAGPGEQLTVGFRRPDGSSGTALITLVPIEWGVGSPHGLAQTWQAFLLLGIMPLLCMLIGYWVVFAKPAEPNAWLLLVLLLFPEAVFSIGDGWATGGWLFFRLAYRDILQNFGFFALVPFAAYFPERSGIDIKLRWLKWVVLGPAFLCGFLGLKHKYWQYYFGGNSTSFTSFIKQVD